MKTFSAKAHEMPPTRKWFVIDAKDQVVGQIAVHAANVLRGKTKPIFTPHVDTGDFVVIINAKDCVFTGKKETDKVYTRVSGYIGNQRRESPKRLRETFPERILERAIKGMIPHNALGREVIQKLHVYSGSEHPHAEHNPEPMKLP